MSISLYQIVKRDGMVVNFDLHKISQVIIKAFEAEREVDSEIDHVLALFCGDTAIDVSYYQDVLLELEERRREIREYREHDAGNTLHPVLVMDKFHLMKYSNKAANRMPMR